ncbi:MAG: hypothetical protein EXR51_03985 [Dehalococcoidia bacterium]|nr:hypothetical protein [Dehalococcoidia bacterium]
MLEPLDKDCSAWAVRTFRTPKATSATISRVVPDGGSTVATLTPALTWANSNPYVFYYEVQVSKDPAFGPNAFLYWELMHAGLASPPSTYQVSDKFPLEAATNYYWRVRPRIQGDGTPVSWSTTWGFVTP